MAIEVESHLDEHEATATLHAELMQGLTHRFKQIPSKWLYDDVGCALFEQITQLPEYYPTRREHAILKECAPHIAALVKPQTLVELGAGSARKTRLLLDACSAAGTLARYVPVDVAPEALHATAVAVSGEYPTLEIRGVVADFERHIALLPKEGRRLIVFLGGTIGNLAPDARRRFLQTVADQLRPNEAFLLGTDLVKNPTRLVAAYDDAAGVTAAFNRNVLAALNRQLKADFVPDAFDHVASWDSEQEWMEMRLRAQHPQRVHVAELGLDMELAQGESIRTEISAKFRRLGLTTECAAAGLRPLGWWTDRDDDFALSLWSSDTQR